MYINQIQKNHLKMPQNIYQHIYYPIHFNIKMFNASYTTK